MHSTLIILHCTVLYCVRGTSSGSRGHIQCVLPPSQSQAATALWGGPHCPHHRSGRGFLVCVSHRSVRTNRWHYLMIGRLIDRPLSYKFWLLGDKNLMYSIYFFPLFLTFYLSSSYHLTSLLLTISSSLLTISPLVFSPSPPLFSLQILCHCWRLKLQI